MPSNTAPAKIQGLRVAILATDGVEEAELVEPRKALNEAGAKTTLISMKLGEIQAMKHDDKSTKYDVDATFDSVDPQDFDALLLPGGGLNADALRVVADAQEFVRAIDEAGKPIAFICHAPWLLISANVVEGRTLTSYHTIQDDVRNAGGTWVDEEVVRDDNWVSSRQPSDIPAFNREMIKVFGESKVKGSKSPLRFHLAKLAAHIAAGGLLLGSSFGKNPTGVTHAPCQSSLPICLAI